MKRTIVLFLVAVGCGSSKPAPAPAPAGGSGEAMHGEGEMDMSPELTKFHDLLAPRWHAEPGAPRMKSTCDAVPEFLADADAVAQAAPPAGGDPGAWKTQAAELTDAVGALKTTCNGGDAAAFEPAFARVHAGFHHMMEAGGMHHDGGHDMPNTLGGDHHDDDHHGM